MKSFKKHILIVIIVTIPIILVGALWLHDNLALRGLYGTYYLNTDWQGEPWKKGVLDREILDHIPNFQQAKEHSQNHFSVEWEGYIRIPAKDRYEFEIESDDGSWLWIDDMLVVDNGGIPRGLQKENGVIELTKGLHKIRIRYVQFGGEAILRVFWAIKGAQENLITAEVLSASISPTKIMKYLVVWGSVVLYASIMLFLSSRKTSLLLLLLLLAILLFGHYGIKSLELLEYWSNGQELQSYFKISRFLQHNAPWKLLLPLEVSNDRYIWTVTGQVVMSLLELLDPHRGTYIALFVTSTLLIVTTFTTCWMISRSTIFTVTMTMGMAFGTQFNGLYGSFAIAALYLYLTYIQINIMSLYLLFKKSTKGFRLKFLFIVSFIVIALSFEYWIDYGTCLFASMLYLFWIFKKRHDRVSIKKVKFVLIALILITACYMSVKLTYSVGVSDHFARGFEGEVVLTYFRDDWRLGVMAIEDMLSNVFTYIYLAFSNYFPSVLLSSNSMYYFGEAGIIKHQYGYHVPKLVYYHHMFSWYFLAGIVTFVFFYFFYRNIRRSFKDPSNNEYIIFTLISMLVAGGFFVRTFIKYRPYLSVPLLTYKCILSILGVTYLIAFVTVRLKKFLTNRAVYLGIVICIWTFILYGGITRNARLAQLAHEIAPGERYKYIPYILQDPPFENYKKWQLIKQNSKK